MKAIKYLATVVVALALPLAFTSCGDDDDFYDPMILANTVWEAHGCTDNEYNFDGARFHFGVGTGYVDNLQFGNWNWSSSNFSYYEDNDGYIRINFDSNDQIEGYLYFDNTGDYAEFTYHWTNEGVSFHMNLDCIAE